MMARIDPGFADGISGTTSITTAIFDSSDSRRNPRYRPKGRSNEGIMMPAFAPDCARESTAALREKVDLQPARKLPVTMTDIQKKRVEEAMAPVTGTVQAGDPAGSTLRTVYSIGEGPETFNENLVL
jgi:hypothetical protein